MIVFYDPTDINQVRAVYTSPPQSTEWAAFTRADVPGRLIPGLHMLHHKVRVVANPDYPDTDPDNEFLHGFSEMTAAEKTAHPIPVP